MTCGLGFICCEPQLNHTSTSSQHKYWQTEINSTVQTITTECRATDAALMQYQMVIISSHLPSLHQPLVLGFQDPQLPSLSQLWVNFALPWHCSILHCRQCTMYVATMGNVCGRIYRSAIGIYSHQSTSSSCINFLIIVIIIILDDSDHHNRSQGIGSQRPNERQRERVLLSLFVPDRLPVLRTWGTAFVHGLN